MTRTPWMKWYPSDWRGDALVQACEPLARYVWIEMLGLMHEAEPYGHLVSAGRAMDYRTLSRLIGMDSGDVKRAVKQLEAVGVFSRTDKGVIYSRRMVRDKTKAEINRQNGGLGGNPALKDQGLKPPPDNPSDKGADKTHIPEARDQKNHNHENDVAGPHAPAPAREAFPADGSIAYTPWAERARKRGRNIDVDILAQAFRAFCRQRDIDLAGPWIGRTFDTFVSKHKVPGAA